ncbi:MAG: hypothetical protein JNJ52_04610 [Flavobacterium sp.]|nr:hypothetical protein [Flavobacterium sp.]
MKNNECSMLKYFVVKKETSPFNIPSWIFKIQKNNERRTTNIQCRSVMLL